jgi:hypothetical protein
MTNRNLERAAKKIVEHIAKTGEPRAKAIKYCWQEIALDPKLVERCARQFLDGGWDFGAYEDYENIYWNFGCVSRVLRRELSKYYEPQARNIEVLDSMQVEKAISLMVPLFGKPGKRCLHKPKGQRISWWVKNQEMALQMLSLLSTSGIKCYYYGEHPASVRIYGPWTDRWKINNVEKALDGQLVV